jgi:hypothetical protein
MAAVIFLAALVDSVRSGLQARLARPRQPPLAAVLVIGQA